MKEKTTVTSEMPARIGQFVIESEIGRGHTGVVYLARQVDPPRPAVIKVIHPQLVDDPRFVAHFCLEAAVLAKVDSPHIVKIYDHGHFGNDLFIATEYVAGENLGSFIKHRGRLTIEIALRIFAQILSGLRTAHTQGIIHSNIKPSNILLRTDRDYPHIYLCDFGGTSSTGDHLQDLTDISQEELAYIAPERLRGLPASIQSDLYSAACILWSMLTGRMTFTDADREMLSNDISAAIPAILGNDALAKALQEMFTSCLADDPNDRLADVGTLLGSENRFIGTYAESSSTGKLRVRANTAGQSPASPSLANPPAMPSPASPPPAPSPQSSNILTIDDESALPLIEANTPESAVQPVESSLAGEQDSTKNETLTSDVQLTDTHESLDTEPVELVENTPQIEATSASTPAKSPDILDSSAPAPTVLTAQHFFERSDNLLDSKLTGSPDEKASLPNTTATDLSSQEQLVADPDSIQADLGQPLVKGDVERTPSDASGQMSSSEIAAEIPSAASSIAISNDHQSQPDEYKAVKSATSATPENLLGGKPSTTKKNTLRRILVSVGAFVAIAGIISAAILSQTLSPPPPEQLPAPSEPASSEPVSSIIDSPEVTTTGNDPSSGVPLSLAGKTSKEAIAEIEAIGASYEVEEVWTIDSPAGTVISVSPEIATAKDIVTLRVSLGKGVMIPNVVGDNKKEVEKELKSLGLIPKVHIDYADTDSDSSESEVISKMSELDEIVPKETLVELWVSKRGATATYTDWVFSSSKGLTVTVNLKNVSTKTIEKVNVNLSFYVSEGKPANNQKDGMVAAQGENTATIKLNKALNAGKTATISTNKVIYNKSVHRVDIDSLDIVFQDGSKQHVTDDWFWYDKTYKKK